MLFNTFIVFCLLSSSLPVCLQDTMIRLKEDDRAPPVDSIDTEKRSAERWPPDSSPPGSVWWVTHGKKKKTSCIHKWHCHLLPCQLSIPSGHFPNVHVHNILNCTVKNRAYYIMVAFITTLLFSFFFFRKRLFLLTICWVM